LVLILTQAVGARADLLWDNYHTGPNGHDGVSALSSERDTIIPQSWTADDATFDAGLYPQGVAIQEVRWIGMSEDGATYGQADAIILDENFNTVWEASGLSYTVLQTLPPNFANHTTYEASVNITDVELGPGRYYIATRLVGDSALGRNFVATTGEGVNFGNAPNHTEGAFRSDVFGFPQWTLVSQVPLVATSDFAYQIHGVAIPEPAGLLLIVTGGLALLRRRVS
jgi:hypothetical protein